MPHQVGFPIPGAVTKCGNASCPPSGGPAGRQCCGQCGLKQWLCSDDRKPHTPHTDSSNSSRITILTNPGLNSPLGIPNRGCGSRQPPPPSPSTKANPGHLRGPSSKPPKATQSPPQSHLQAIYLGVASHPQATHKPPPCDPHATHMRPTCDPHATLKPPQGSTKATPARAKSEIRGSRFEGNPESEILRISRSPAAFQSRPRATG